MTALEQAMQLMKLINEYGAMGPAANVAVTMLGDVASLITGTSLIKTCYDALVPVGVGLIIILSVASLLEQTIEREVTLDHFIRCFIKILVGTLFLQNGYDILVFIIKLSDAIMNSLTISITEVINEAADLPDVELSIFSFLEAVMEAGMAVPKVIQLVCVSVAAAFVGVQRKVECCIYVALAPIAFYDVTSRDFRETQAFRYIMNFAAIAIQGIICVLVIYVTYQLHNSYPITVSNPVVRKYAMDGVWWTIIMMMLMFQSKRIAKAILGVR